VYAAASVDDGFSPPRTVEQTRALIEEDNVLAIADSLGIATNGAVRKPRMVRFDGGRFTYFGEIIDAGSN
jgi:hypothetical protein